MSTGHIVLDHHEVCLLLDYYGELLTARRLRMMRLYYHEDFSLAEIAERFSVSRQAVHDNIQQAMRQLAAYELALHQMEQAKVRKQQLRLAEQALRQKDWQLMETALDQLNRTID